MSRLSRHYAKLCDLRDFADPEVAAVIPQIAPQLSAERPHRKAWEFAMGALFLRDTGHLDGSAEILDVGAGGEEILFWLAGRAARVVAVDVYGQGPFRDREASASMLEDPDAHAPYDYPRERLEVRHMDARALDFPNSCFDAVVSFSSIEHFGGPSGIRRAAREIGRVLRPGGHALIVTELFIHQGLLARAPAQFVVRLATLGRRCTTATPRRRATEVLGAAEVQRWIVRPAGLQLMQPLALELSPESRANPHHMVGGTPRSVSGEPFPHIVLQAAGSTFTSACLPLVKPGG